MDARVKPGHDNGGRKQEMTEVHIADTDDKIAACFPVMHELRPHLTDAADLVARVRRM